MPSLEFYEWIALLAAMFAAGWFVQDDHGRQKDRDDFLRYLFIPAKKSLRTLARRWKDRSKSYQS